MTKKLVCMLMTAGCATSGVAAQAQNLPGGAQLNNGVFFIEGGPSALDAFQQSRLQDSGYRIDPSDMSSSNIVRAEAQRIFAQQASLRNKMPASLPSAFNPILSHIDDYINKIGKAGVSDNEAKNHLPNQKLAEKLVRLSFCFGTDPYGLTAQLGKESTFDRTRTSGTGAVGLTQMTSRAIDEVNDQLGSRGNSWANIASTPYLRQAIACYTSGRTFSSMFEAGVVPRAKLVAKNEALAKRAKAWLRADIDRDLIYGQIYLKVMIARARAGGRSGLPQYSTALQKYNGEPKGRDKVYAKSIIASMQSI